MAVIAIPTLTDGTPHYSQRVQLEGNDYVFTFRFGERRNAWVFDLATLDGVGILTGQLVTVYNDWLRRASMPERPPGVLWAMNLQRPEGDPRALPGLYDLGDRCVMYYTESTTAEDNAADGVTSLDDL
jgi:hypothetical protein